MTSEGFKSQSLAIAIASLSQWKIQLLFSIDTIWVGILEGKFSVNDAKEQANEGLEIDTA